MMKSVTVPFAFAAVSGLTIVCDELEQHLVFHFSMLVV